MSAGIIRAFDKPDYCVTITTECADCIFRRTDDIDCTGNAIDSHYVERHFDTITPILTGFVDDLEDEIEQRRRLSARPNVADSKIMFEGD